jgi:hypothetical protein
MGFDVNRIFAFLLLTFAFREGAGLRNGEILPPISRRQGR